MRRLAMAIVALAGLGAMQSGVLPHLGLRAAPAADNDQRVADLLAKNLKASEVLKGFQIKVQYREGTARLQGWVRNHQQLTEALAIANRSSYALTGGLFSRSPAHIERSRREFRVGNLYINRGITGAVVERQPFGGLKLSGIGSKAGGPDYLLQFMEPRTISENTLRHGFVPPEDLKE